MSRPELESTEITASSRTRYLIKEQPAVAVGVTAALGIIAYQVFNAKKKLKTMPLQLVVIHTRMFAQGTLVGVVALSAGWGIMKYMYEEKMGIPHPQKKLGHGLKHSEHSETTK